MKFIHVTGAGLFTLMAAATPTLAADMPVKSASAPAAAAVALFNWTGFYAGLQAGYGWGRGRNIASDFQDSNKPAGWLAGGQAGYNVQSGNWVWGAEIDGAWTNIENNVNECDCIIFVRIGDLITARLRGGPAIGNTFYYVTGGFASGKVKFHDFDDPAQAPLAKRHNGYAVGFGAEHAFAPNWSAKLEYLYVDLGNKNYDLGGEPDRVEVKTHLVRAGLNYRFATGKSPGPVVTKY